jgi:hypothetical protein
MDYETQARALVNYLRAIAKPYCTYHGVENPPCVQCERASNYGFQPTAGAGRSGTLFDQSEVEPSTGGG